MTDGATGATPDAVTPRRAADAVSPASEPAPVCATCGTTPADGDAALACITWSRGVDNGRDVWTCATCSRHHLRSIEGKLDSTWW